MTIFYNCGAKFSSITIGGTPKSKEERHLLLIIENLDMPLID
jgi:hypothetical protein